MRRDERIVKALLDRGADANARLETWTPTRRSSNDWNFAPELVGATPFWLAARFAQPNVMRLLLAHGADPMIVHRVAYHAGDPPVPRSDVTTALMAATGMGGGAAWVRRVRAEPEPQVLEAVKLTVELGVDVNAANTDGRTALNAAQALKYESVVKYLEAHGAKAGTVTAPARRGGPPPVR
jgi:ankyrin repeat protein